MSESTERPKVLPASDYPEHDKMLRISNKSQAIGEFLEWLGSEKNVQLMTWIEQEEDVSCPGWMYNDCIEGFVPLPDEAKPSNRVCQKCGGKGTVKQTFKGYVPQPQPIEALLADHFEIDLKAIEREKRAMLERMREVTR